MDFLFVKTKGKRGSFCKVLSDQQVYCNIPSFEDNRPYNDEVRLRENQWFVLANFSEKKYAPSLVKEEFNAARWSQIDRADYGMIDYIISVQDDGSQLMFQNVTNSLIYRRQSLLSLDDQPSLLNKKHLLVIHEQADAYYQRENDCLYFQRLSSITSIFPGINELYNEATDAEVEVVLSLPMLNIAPDFTKNNVKTANRRKIRGALDMYNQYNNQQKEQLPLYMQKYCPDLSFNDVTRKFEISDEKTLTLFLNGLCQRYYTTEISQEKKVALSTERV